MSIVERLRHADLHAAQRIVGSDIFGAAADEIERLRAALTKIADLVDSEGDEPLDDAISIAKKALGSNAEQSGDGGKDGQAR